MTIWRGCGGQREARMAQWTMSRYSQFWLSSHCIAASLCCVVSCACAFDCSLLVVRMAKWPLGSWHHVRPSNFLLRIDIISIFYTFFFLCFSDQRSAIECNVTHSSQNVVCVSCSGGKTNERPRSGNMRANAMYFLHSSGSLFVRCADFQAIIKMQRDFDFNCCSFRLCRMSYWWKNEEITATVDTRVRRTVQLANRESNVNAESNSMAVCHVRKIYIYI